MARLPEQRAWDNFKPATVGRFKAHRVENQLGNGMPDVICINKQGTVFWIENKALLNWPVRAATLPMAKKFEPGQLGFMREWQGRGGKAFVLLRVEKVYYLLNPKLDLEGLTADQLKRLATATTKESILQYLETL